MMKLIADSSANLTMLEGVTYQSVPMTIRAGERDFVDDETLDTHELLDYLAAHNGKSGTACPSLDGWLKAFEGADEIFVITITSSLSGTCAYFLAGLGLLSTAVWVLPGSTIRLARVAMVVSVAGGLVMFYSAFLKLCRKRLPYWLPAMLAVVLMLDTVAQCQAWGTEPQLQVYFFPLMASVFLILSAYQKTAYAAGRGNPKLLAFFSQSALFFCCLSLDTPQWPLFAGMLFWAAVQLYPCILVKKEA